MAAAEGIVGEFLDLKADADVDILAMQCGDFYEFFGEDAEIVSRELDLKVSEKSSGGTKYPMAGVPVDDLTPYLTALVERGHRVAVADQYETENGHAREVTRIVTPGTLVETGEDSAYLVAIVRATPTTYGLAIGDVTTGRCLATELDGADAADRVLTECYRFDPVEILPGPDVREDDALLDTLGQGTEAVITDHDVDAFAPGRARSTTDEQFGPNTVESIGLDSLAVRAVGALVDYIAESGVGVLPAMSRLTPYDDGEFVALDMTTQRNLELTEPMLPDGVTLLEVVDHTVTAAGRRRLREWVTRPRRDPEIIAERLDIIDGLTAATMAREAIRDMLDGTGDVERLASRATRGSADGHTLLAIARALETIPQVVEAIEGDPQLASSPLVRAGRELDRETIDALADELSAALAPEQPRTLTEGGLIRKGYDAEVDALRERHEHALEWIDGLAERERAAHDITHLQVDRNRTDGFYIQVGNSETDAVPQGYREIKTLKHSKRYTTPELDEHEREILRLEEARAELEYERFCALRERVVDSTDAVQAAGRFLARLDALASLATHAVERRWVRPSIDDPGGRIDIEDGRHPVVETTTEFVPNGVSLDEEARLALVTGPNMSGKSTYLRQTALIVLLAQIGSFVPAASARIGLVDGIYTRVGALDELSQGRSTFMVEMQELAHILHAASEQSLVILDEVGRGTATYDGISIAWAATEYLHNEVCAKGLFATHYHELTELAAHLPGVTNLHVSVEEHGDRVVFLRSIEPGATDRSYGVHVADLAGVPAPVVARGRDVLARLRSDRTIDARGADAGPTQVVFDVTSGEMASTDGPDPTQERVVDELVGLDLATISPLELFDRVRAWQEQLDTDDAG